MDANVANFKSRLDQNSARCRDSKKVEISELDLTLLVDMARLGVAFTCARHGAGVLLESPSKATAISTIEWYRWCDDAVLAMANGTDVIAACTSIAFSAAQVLRDRYEEVGLIELPPVEFQDE